MTQIEWAMWANEQAIASALITILGGIIGISGSFAKWQFAAYAVAAGVVVLILEYPRSLRAKGKSTPRSDFYLRLDKMIQMKPADKAPVSIAVFLNAMGPLGQIYYFRVFFYLMLCIPCVFLLPTLLGGICLLISSILYFVAALKGERWRADFPKKEESQKTEVMTPPTLPPPRRQVVFATSQKTEVMTPPNLPPPRRQVVFATSQSAAPV